MPDFLFAKISSYQYKMSKKTKTALILSSIIVFLISLFNNCYVANQTEDTIGSFGLAAFLFGWMNVSKSFIVWCANPFFILTIILLFVRRIAAVVTASVAFALAVSFQFFDEVLINEGGTVAKITSFSIGYWLWLTSIGLLLLTAILNLKTADSKHK